MDKLAARAEARLQRAWRTMVRQVRDDLSLAEVEAFVRANDLEQLAASLEAAAEKFAGEVAASYAQSAQRTARLLDASVDGRAVRFNVANERSIAWMEDRTSEFVRGFVAEQRDVAARVMQLARSRGAGEKVVAQEVLDSIGLGASHVDHVESYRRAVASGDFSNLLDRELADGRFDRSIASARSSGSQLSAQRQEAMLTRYRENWVTRRGEFIAQSEGFMAAHAGQKEALAQAVEAKDLAASRVTQVWHTRGDHKVRHSHRTMSGQRRKLGEAFESGYGNLLRYPHDPDAPLSETANCRCVIELVVREPRARSRKIGSLAELAY
jgi:hypothetical protein